MTDASALRLAVFTDTYAPQVNGVARTLARLADAVAERGGCARVFTVTDPGMESGDLRDDDGLGSNVVRYASRPFWAYPELRLAWPSQRRVRRDLAAFAPTIVHAATEFGVGLAGRRAARALGVPFVSSYHTSFASYARYYRLGFLARPGWGYLRWFHNGGLRTWCPTEAIAREIASHGFVHTGIWSRGVDTERFAPSFRSASLRARMGAGEDTLVVLYVGRLAAEKGLGGALDAVQRADAARPGRIRFAFVGDGPYEHEVRRMAPAGSWLPGRMLGAALSEAYASADVFLFPSETDTFGNVLVEAMASGLPVVGADVGPTRELVSAERGWLARPGSAEDFARTLVALVDDRDAVCRAGGHARAFAEGRRWADVWDGLIGEYLTLHRAAPTADSA